MDKDKLIEKKFTYFPNHGDDNGRNCYTIIYDEGGDDEIITGAEDTETDAIEACKRLNSVLTALTAPVPDGKVKRETVIMNKYIEKVGYGMDLFSECEIETITTILDILEDLTKTPDAG